MPTVVDLDVFALHSKVEELADEVPEQFNPILATTLASFGGRVRKS